MQPLLEVRDVSLQYPGQASRAVDGVSFSLKQGEILALLGPSGCGKTSLLRLIAGFELPQVGTIVVNGQVLSSPDRCIPPEQRNIGIVFQDFALFPHMTVYQNVAFGLRRSQSAGAVMEVLERVRLQDYKDQYPHQLSGGQQQRVALARVLVTNPILVLLDEPLSNIDVQLRSSLRRELREILQQAGTTSIWVTHDQEEAMAVADWIGVMQGGKLEQLDTPQGIYCQPKTPFVAQFVSQANLLPLPLAAVAGLQELPATNGAKEKQLMILQEDICLQVYQDSDCVITDRVFLGREWVYYVKLPSSQELIARVSNRCAPLPVGTKVAIGGKWQLI
ncbi:MAG: ABC transporter ATP-binding protein [Pseudanabaenaceae cyanobacterium SKYGB_i_bin29]|nr:ABC transporter ATP-binding protein [Pseudanabaenaceae cyanobacterium SKYG29]MDW8420396.1 ABC transporter ATP-binding protein [Pseudanabaenaceae cyanobacterium SKYGB_i_bin29]